MIKQIVGLMIALSAFATAKAQEPADSLAYLRSELDEANQQLLQKDKELKEMAQKEKWNSIWGKGKYTLLSYAPSAKVTVQGAYDEKSKFVFAIAKGNTYFFHKKPIAGLLKIGLDVRWTDIQVTKYKDLELLTSDNWQDNPEGDEDDSSFLDNLGRWDLHLGAFGVGPTISVAPFSMFDNAAKYLRITFYGHYQPTFGLHLVSQDGETDTSMAYCNMFNAGG